MKEEYDFTKDKTFDVYTIEELLEQYRDNDYYNLSKIENMAKLCEEIERLNNIINHIEEICKSSIASVDKHLLDNKEIKVKDGRILNYNDYQIIRLKAFRTKSKEILGRIKELKGVDKE